MLTMQGNRDTNDRNSVTADSEIELGKSRAAKDKSVAGDRGDGVRTDILAEALSMSRSTLDSLLLQTNEIHQTSWRAIQSAFEDLHLRLCRECETRVAGFAEEIRKRGRFEVTACLETVEVEVRSRLDAHVDQMLNKAEEWVQRGGQLLEAKVENSRTELEELATKTSHEVVEHARKCVDDLQTDGKKRIGELQSALAVECENTVHKSLESLREQFSKQVSDSVEAFQQQVERINAENAKSWNQRLKDWTDAAVARLSTEAHAIVTRETSAHLLETLRGRLEQMVNSLKD